MNLAVRLAHRNCKAAVPPNICVAVLNIISNCYTDIWGCYSSIAFMLEPPLNLDHIDHNHGALNHSTRFDFVVLKL